MTWLGSGIKYPREKIKNRKGFNFREWIPAVSFLSFSFHLSHTLAPPFLQMRQYFFWDFQVKMEPKGFWILLSGFFYNGGVAISMQFVTYWPKLVYKVPFKWRPELESFALLTYLDMCLSHFSMGPYLMTGWETSHLVLFHLHVSK